jgi:hypothetical protein
LHLAQRIAVAQVLLRFYQVRQLLAALEVLLFRPVQVEDKVLKEAQLRLLLDQHYLPIQSEVKLRYVEVQVQTMQHQMVVQLS